jgi:hypothetical protein
MAKDPGAHSLVICIAGMPRSGSSLVTQLLHRAGLDLGLAADLMPASINNSDGFWENLRFVRLNERLLSASNGSWYAPPATLRPTRRILADASSIARSFEGREPWGWKDPRNSVTLSFWRSVLPTMKVLICLRHPAESAASLGASTLLPASLRFVWNVTHPASQIHLHDHARTLSARVKLALRTSTSAERRRSLIEEVGLELWRIYNSTVLTETRDCDRLVTHYDAVLADPSAELQRIVSWAGIEVSPDRIEEAVRVVKPRLRHQRSEAPVLEPRLERLYAQLCDEAARRP